MMTADPDKTRLGLRRVSKPNKCDVSIKNQQNALARSRRGSVYVCVCVVWSRFNTIFQRQIDPVCTSRLNIALFTSSVAIAIHFIILLLNVVHRYYYYYYPSNGGETKRPTTQRQTKWFTVYFDSVWLNEIDKFDK